MQTFNFFANQFVDVSDMMAIQAVPQSAIKDILLSLVDKGVITGVAVVPTAPTASLAVNVQSGKMYLEDGSGVTTGSATLLDLSALVAALTAGQSGYATIYAIPTQVSDTPVVTPGGGTIQYRTYDSVEFVVVMGTPTTGSPALGTTPPVGFTGVLIADILLTAGMTQILSGAISQGRLDNFINIPYILSLIAAAGLPPYPQSDVTGLVAALAAINAHLTTLDGQVSALGTRATTDEGAITALQTRATTDETAITALQARATTDEADITTLDGEVATLNSEVATINTDITAIDAEIAALTPTSGSNSNGFWFKDPTTGVITQWGFITGLPDTGITAQSFPIPYTNLASIVVNANDTNHMGGNVRPIGCIATAVGSFNITAQGSGANAAWRSVGI